MKKWLLVCLISFSIVSTSAAQTTPIELPHAGFAGFGDWSSTHVLTTDSFNVYLWDAATGARLMHIATGEEYVFHIAFNPDESQFFWAGADVLHVVDVGVKKEIARFEIDNMEGEWSADGKRLLADLGGSQSFGVVMWDTASWEETLHFKTPGPVSVLEWNRAETRVMVRYQSADRMTEYLVLLDAASGEVITAPVEITNIWQYRYWSPDDRFIVTFSVAQDDMTEIYLWDGGDGQSLQTFRLPDRRGVSWHDATTLVVYPVNDRDITPIIFLDVLTGEEVETPMLFGAIRSPDGTKALLEDEKLTGFDLLNTADGSSISHLFVPKLPRGDLYYPEWSPHSRHFAFVLDNRVQVRDSASGAIVRVLQSEDTDPIAVYWRPDGKALLVVYFQNPTMHLWTGF